ncbi:hypothetical protein M2171_006099 [Bradyrhizobium japonicum USDA 38]|nr:hypothetical protein [Bradyrhizobium japonicum USDA 38]MCS3949481.1 hypothetical protein [Bradyrhizobium japonicum]
MVGAAVGCRAIDAQRAFKGHEARGRPEVDLIAAFAEVEPAESERRKRLQIGCGRLIAGLLVAEADLARQWDLRLHGGLDRCRGHLGKAATRFMF